MGYVWLDIETRSSCDLRAEGGRRYAEHPSTEILTVAYIHEDTRHVWIPSIPSAPKHLVDTQLPGVTLHFGPTNPVPDGPTVSHNAWGFDSHVWERFYPKREWIDTEPLARSCGLPGGYGRTRLVKNARQLYAWRGNSLTLFDVALNGPKKSQCRLSETIKEIEMTEVCGIIFVEEKQAKEFRDFKSE